MVADAPDRGRKKKLILAGRFLAGEFKEFDCAHCEAAGPAARRERGCEEPAARAFFEIPEYGELDRCPVAVLTEESRDAMRFYPFWEAGRYPVAGGLLDQPNTLVEAMAILTRTVRLCEVEAIEARKRER